jgi:hypothetical protein
VGRKVDEQSSEFLVWETPPSPVPYNWQSIARQLKAHPMAWAKVDDGVKLSTINALRQGSIRALHKDLGFEVRTRNNTRHAPRTATLYLRWNPDTVRDSLRESIQTSRKEK